MPVRWPARGALGPNHPDVARSLNNLATLYRLQGQPDRARPLQERAVAIADSSLGRRNPDTQQMRRNLAALDKAPPAPAAARGAGPRRRQVAPPAPSRRRHCSRTGGPGSRRPRSAGALRCNWRPSPRRTSDSRVEAILGGGFRS